MTWNFLIPYQCTTLSFPAILLTVMEFESSPSTDDEARRLAAMKQITLTPLHADIAPEEDPSIERNVEQATPTSNITIDNENTADHGQLESTQTATQETDSAVTTTHSRPIHWLAITGAVLVCLLFVAVVLAVWYLKH